MVEGDEVLVPSVYIRGVALECLRGYGQRRCETELRNVRFGLLERHIVADQEEHCTAQHDQDTDEEYEALVCHLII